jgi:mannose-1-phosphate guanylyltransferase
MLPVAGVPFLAHQLALMRAAGVDHVVLATSYQPHVFVDYFGDGGAAGLAIEYVVETEALGTGGGIRNVADRLRAGPDDPVLVLNGDVISGHDIRAQIAEHIGVRCRPTNWAGSPRFSRRRRSRPPTGSTPGATCCAGR